MKRRLAFIAHLFPDVFTRAQTVRNPLTTEQKGKLLFAMLLALLVTVLPYTILQPPTQVQAASNVTSNAITVENAQPGSTGWQFDYDNTGTPLKASNHEIEGYAS